MHTAWFDTWLNTSSLVVVGGVLLLLMIAAAVVGVAIRSARDKRVAPGHSESQEGYIVSAVLGLMALLLGFTFSLAVDRYDTRRERVLEGANAIGTAYLQTQLLAEPHRARISNILVRYVDNAILLARARPGEGKALLARDDELLTELWAASAAGFDSVRGIDFSSTFVSSMNTLIDMDSSRRAARAAHVPGEVFAVLFVYFTVTAGVLGYVLTGSNGRLSAGFLLVLMVLSLMLVLDIDRPTLGGVREAQGPMEELQKSLAQSPAVFDRWRTPPTAAAAAGAFR